MADLALTAEFAMALFLLAAVVVVFTPLQAVAAATAIVALVAGVVALLTRGVGDAFGLLGPVTIGAAMLVGAGVGALLAPSLWPLWSVIAGVGTGGAIPPLTGRPDARRATRRNMTPRSILPVPFHPSIAAARRHRLGIVWSLGGGAVAALGMLCLMVGAPAAALVSLLAGAGLMSLGIRIAVRPQNPLAATTVAGAVSAAGFFGSGAAALAGAVSVSLPAGVRIAIAAGALVAVSVVVLYRPRYTGRLSRPGSRNYRAAVRTFDAVRLAPTRAAVVTTPDQVGAAIEEARAFGLDVRMHSTGHKAGTSPPVRASALLKVRIAEPVSVDAAARTVRMPAGATWDDVVTAITPHGLGAPHGYSGRVGAVGYLLGGGLSAYARVAGVAANSIDSIELVLADGTHVVADPSTHADLFWALRGGGGGFGVVTAITLRLFDLASVITGTSIWDGRHTKSLIHAWYSWTRTAPAQITTSLRVVKLPPLPGFRPSLTRRQVVVVDASIPLSRTDDLATAQRTVAGLQRALSEHPPMLDSYRVASPYETAFTHMDPPITLPQVTDSFTFTADEQDPLDRLAELANLETLGLSIIELRHLGGALALPSSEGGVASTIDGDFFYWGLGLPNRRNPASRISASLREIRGALSPWATGVVVPNYSPDGEVPHRLFDARTREDVSVIRQKYDPHGLFADDVAIGAR